MNILIFEDDKFYGNELANKMENILMGMDKNSEILLCSNDSSKILQLIKKTSEYFLCLLDICVGADNCPVGLELAKKIKNHNENHMVVFITNYPDTFRFDIQAKINSFAYILKNSPMFDYELESVLLTAKRNHGKSSLAIKNQHCLLHSIPLDNIYSIESIKGKHKTGVYHANGYVETYETLNNIQKRLDKRFTMCSRSCILNMDKAVQLNKSLHIRKITTCNNRTHYISLSRLGAVQNAFDRNRN